MESLLNIENFSDIYKISKNFTTTEKGFLFELLTKYIFLLHSNFTHKTQNIWLYDEIPIEIKEKYNLPPKDKGIDLILETFDKDYIPIQCKFRSNVLDKVDWTSLSTFAGQVFVCGFQKAIFVTNTYDINEEIQKCGKISCVYGDFFDNENLGKDFFDNIKRINKKKEMIYIKRIPRDYQKDIIDDSVKYFDKYDRGYLSIACGAGKTFISCKIDNIMNNKLIVIFVPSLYLLSQIYREWAYDYTEEKQVNFILCGSDTETKDIPLIPFLSTNTEGIKSEIQKSIDKYTKTIIISTYQSCNVIKFGLDNKIVDLIIFDEAHKTVNDGFFSIALYDKNIKAKKRLFVTATPKVYREKKVDDKQNHLDEEKYEVVSMDNEKLYGNCIYTYQLSQAIKDKNLTPYEFRIMHINENDIKIAQNKYVNIDDTLCGYHYVATAFMIKDMIEKKEINHLLTYHSKRINAENFSNLLRIILDNKINIGYIDGEMTSNKKYEIIKNFKDNKISILASARVLNEGINIPEVDSVCFVEPRNSGIDIVQCIGRSLRLYKEKEKAKILIPLLEKNLNDNKYSEIIKILKNLNEYDYNIVETIKSQKETNKKLINVSGYNFSEKKNNNDFIDINEIYDKITTQILENIDINTDTDADDQKYLCHHCNRGFNRKDGLDRHLNKKIKCYNEKNIVDPKFNELENRIFKIEKILHALLLDKVKPQKDIAENTDKIVNHMQNNVKKTITTKNIQNIENVENDIYSRFMKTKTKKSTTHIHTKDLYNHFKKWYSEIISEDDIPSNVAFIKNIRKNNLFYKSIKVNNKVSSGLKNLELC
jgi:predicted helicase